MQLPFFLVPVHLICYTYRNRTMNHYLTLPTLSAIILLFNSCMVIQCKTGSRIDACGKSIPQARIPRISAPSVSRLGDCYYMPLEVHFIPEQKALIKITTYPLIGDTQRASWPTPETTIESEHVCRYFFPLTSEEASVALGYTVSSLPGRKSTPIADDDFPHEHADIRVAKQLFIPISAKSTTQLNYTLNTSEHIPGIPTIRSTGNYIRMPLSVLFSWGIDLPLTLAVSVATTVATYGIGAAALPIGVLAATFLESPPVAEDSISPEGDPPPRRPIPPPGTEEF